MADKPIPDDRAMIGVLEKLKAYSASKARQSQMPPSGGTGATDEDLRTIEDWANDTSDSGAAWGQRKGAESDQHVQEAQKWNERVKCQDKEAAAAADFRSKLDVQKTKDEIKKKLDDHVAAMQGLADAGEPGFKGAAARVKRQTIDAKKFIDEDFEKSLKQTAEHAEKQRQQLKATAAVMEKKGEQGKAWQAQFGGQPDKFPAGQQADVQAALDNVNNTAGALIAELQPFGARAAPHIDGLKKVQAWATKLEPQVSAGAKTAKGFGKSGVAEARTTFANVENFRESMEGEATDNLDLFRRWTEKNNNQAKQWIRSDNPKQRAWAEAWIKAGKGGQ